MTEMKPQEGRIIAGPSLRGSMGRSAAGHNGRVAKEKTSAVWQGGWMPENISGVPAGRSVFLLTSPLIGLLDNVDAGISSVQPVVWGQSQEPVQRVVGSRIAGH